MDQQQALELVAAKIADCTRCGELCQTRQENGYRTVPGCGPPNAKIMAIGEAPGQSEAQSGLPFIGPAGQLLNRAFRQVGISYQDVFITNILKDRPPQNRDPRPDEVANCIPYLHLQVDVVQPKVILCLGRVAAVNFLELPADAGMETIRQQIHIYKCIPVMCTYHPSFALRVPDIYDKLVVDIAKIVRHVISS